MNASTQYDYISSIWNTSLDNYASMSEYCGALELAASSFSTSSPSEFPHFDSHLLTIIALMGLLASYKITQHNILSKYGHKCLTLNMIKSNLLNEEKMLTREIKAGNKNLNALQVQKAFTGHKGKPKTTEEKAHYAKWIKSAVCRNCKEKGHIKRSCPCKALGDKSTHTNQTTSNSPDDDLSYSKGQAWMTQAFLGMTAWIASPMIPRQYSWFMDSGCSHHMSLILDNFTSYTTFPTPHPIHLANKSTIDAIGEGMLMICPIVNGTIHHIKVERVLHVPALVNGLLSVRVLNRQGISVNLDSGVCTIYNHKNSAVLAQSKGNGNLCELHISHPEPTSASIAPLYVRP